ncbi:unnamed protein product [Urochloa humidicola]
MAAFPVYMLLLPLLAILPFACLRRAVLRRRRGEGTHTRLPPSPWALPMIGHLHHLAGALPHRAMRDLAARHGPLMLLRLGALRVVVASSADAAREVMRERDLDFATRAMSRTIRLSVPDESGGNGGGIIFAPYGDGWRQIRKVCTTELLCARRVHSFRPVREEEAGRLLRAVSAAAAAAEPPARAVNLSGLIAAYVADSSVRAIIGSRFKDREAFLVLLQSGVKMFGEMNLPDLYPSSRVAMLFSRMPGRARRLRQEVLSFLDTIIREHEESNKDANGDKDEDLLDVLLRSPITTDNIKSVIGDLFGAGSDTAATTLQWIMAELMRNPRVMQKAQDEVRHMLAGKQKVTEDELTNLQYMRLVVKETLRLHPPAPLLMPRECRTTCQVLGFDVPKGTMVLVNAWAISRDPKYWDMPEEFVPERFEQSKIDFKGTDFEYTPFGAGRRMCPGIGFALANVELALANLLYHFDWKLPHGTEPTDLDMKEQMGVTTRPLHDLLLLPILRVPLPVD